MNEQEQLALREENQRLNKIITVLLEQNELLKKEISNCKSNNGNSESPTSDIMSNNGKWGIESSNISWNNGIKLSNTSNILLNNGKSEFDTSNILLNNGNKVVISIANPIAINAANVEKLALQMPYRGRWDGRLTKARVLLHTINGGSGAHSTLGSLTGLTPSGIAKTIHYMKRQGLIQRTGFQKFSLTPLSLQWIEQAGIG